MICDKYWSRLHLLRIAMLFFFVVTAGALSVPVAHSLPPVAGDDTATTDEDTPVTIDVLANDYDPEGQTLTIKGVAGAYY
jgi:hypothetical protein